jgi:KDO2-lipid IV(A) lauroyltransferase
MARAGVGEPGRTARDMYRALARGLAELVVMALGHRQAPLPVRVPKDLMERLGQRGTGAIVATAHTGNWDLSACAVASVAPLTVVTKHLSVGWLDRLWQGTRRRQGLALVAAGGAARVVATALRRGELVAMLIDQAPERERGAVRIPFLGEPAWVDLSPALCAARARVPLIVAFPRRLEDDGHTIDVAAVIEPPARPSRRWAEDAMAQATRELESFVRRHPAQWLWMHRRWKVAAPRTARAARREARLAGVSS